MLYNLCFHSQPFGAGAVFLCIFLCIHRIPAGWRQACGGYYSNIITDIIELYRKEAWLAKTFATQRTRDKTETLIPWQALLRDGVSVSPVWVSV